MSDSELPTRTERIELGTTEVETEKDVRRNV